MEKHCYNIGDEVILTCVSAFHKEGEFFTITNTTGHYLYTVTIRDSENKYWIVKPSQILHTSLPPLEDWL